MWKVLCHREEGVTFCLEVLGWTSGTAASELPVEINPTEVVEKNI